MALIVPLDASPLGLACCDPGQEEAGRCRDWIIRLKVAGVRIVIPAITDYEVRRELHRVSATAKLARLDRLIVEFGREPISNEALDRAAVFWAFLRRQGRPTAGGEALDADAILAGMAATLGGPGDSVIVATRNVRHLARFPGVDARDWETIA